MSDDRDNVKPPGRVRPSPYVIPGSVMSAPVEVHAEITDVHELLERTDQRLVAKGIGDEIRSAMKEAVAVLVAHQHNGEKRSADLAAMAAAGKVPVEPVQWWVRAIQAAIKIAPTVASVGAVLVAAVVWLNDAARTSEREAADLRARFETIERDIDSLRRSQEWLWRRVNPDLVPVFPAMPGDSHD